MENNLSVSFELDENQSINFDDYSSDEFAIARMGFLATRPNSHHLEISEEVLRECAPTVLGKWLVGEYTPTKSDLEGHEPTEQIFGIVPKEQQVEFVEESGYVRAYVNVVVSKFYAKEFCEILKRDGAHSVSVEMSVLTENGRGTDDVVKSFHIIGVTCLGTTVHPSVKDSEIEFVRFAEQAESYFDKAHLTAENKEDNKIEFEEEGKEGESKMEIEFAAVNIGDLWTSLYNALRHKYEGYDYCIQDIYEQNGQKFGLIKKYGEDVLYRLDFTLTEEGLTLADEITKVEIEVVETDEIRKFAEPENVEEYRTFAEKPEKEEKDEKTEADEDKTEMSDKEESNAEKEQMSENSEDAEKEKETEMSADEMKAKIAELEAAIEERDNIIMENGVELEDLRKFKNACMEAQRASKVETVMSSVSACMDEKTAEDYREKGMKCEFSALDGWVNEVKAFAFDKMPTKKQKNDEEITRMSGVDNIKREEYENLSPLDALKKKFL